MFDRVYGEGVQHIAEMIMIKDGERTSVLKGQRKLQSGRPIATRYTAKSIFRMFLLMILIYKRNIANVTEKDEAG